MTDVQKRIEDCTEVCERAATFNTERARVERTRTVGPLFRRDIAEAWECDAALLRALAAALKAGIELKPMHFIVPGAPCLVIELPERTAAVNQVTTASA